MSAVLSRSGSHSTINPSEIARDVIRQLAVRRMAPTPDNYASLYAEISGGDATHPVLALLRNLAQEWMRQPVGAALARSLHAALNKSAWQDAEAELGRLVNALRTPAQLWADLMRKLLRQWDAHHVNLSATQKREALEQALNGAGADSQKLHQRVNYLVKGWADLPQAPAEPPKPSALDPVKTGLAAADALRELLAQTLELAVVERMGYTPDLAAHAQRLAQACRSAATVKEVNRLTQDLKQFWIRLELRGETVDEIVRGLRGLLQILIGNAAEVAGDDPWMKAQLERAQTLLAEPVDVGALREAEKNFREVAVRQGTIRHSLDEAKLALKTMVTLFIDRLGTMTEKTGDYQNKVSRYAVEIEGAGDIAQLSTVLAGLLSDTRVVQADMQRTRDELERTRQEAEQREQRVRHLERELEVAANLVKIDPLTNVLNRRGMNDAYVSEEARCGRSGSPLCVGLIDIDNFKQLNDRLGHRAGDGALQHLAAIMRDTVRPSDVVARFGGEEFVVLLPGTPLAEAEKVMVRVQRELTKQLYLHNNERVLITFSAGVALGRPGENRDEHIARADAAMYEAKASGKNRVCRAA